MAGVHFLPSPLIWIYGDDNGNDVECDKHNMSRNTLTCIIICEYIQRNHCGYVFWYDAGRREFYITGMFIDTNVMLYTYVMLCDIFMYALFNELVYKYSHHDTCAG